MRTVAALIVLLLCPGVSWAQTGVPVIRARSKVVTITDGIHLKKNYWYVMPEKVPDVYYVEIPRQPHTVTFTTDLDSISFDVSYGSQHDFVIRLDDGTEARTQVRAQFRDLLVYRRTRPAATNGGDTIPFTLGDNDKIYVKGRINGGPILDFQFDLGAGGSIIKKASVSKVQMTFDRTVTLGNSDGINLVPSSSTNQLEIAGLIWDGVPFAVGDNMTHREDGLIGNGLFHDKVLLIDYDRTVITIRDDVPELPAGWAKHDMILDGVVPYVRGTLSFHNAVREGWFMLDTGAYTSILNADGLSAWSKFAAEFRGLLGPMGGRKRGPTISVGGQTFVDANYSVRRYNDDASALGLLGGDILKRFNLVIDNRGGAVYFRPNGRTSEPFRNLEQKLVRGLLAAVLVAAATVWLVRR